MPSILVDETSFERLVMLSDNIGVIYSGMGPDFRVLVRKGQKKAIEYYMMYKVGAGPSAALFVVASVVRELRWCALAGCTRGLLRGGVECCRGCCVGVCAGNPPTCRSGTQPCQYVVATECGVSRPVSTAWELPAPCCARVAGRSWKFPPCFSRLLASLGRGWWIQERIPVLQLVRAIASIMQEFTQSGGVRPFGVSLLVAGFDDDGPQLYQVRVECCARVTVPRVHCAANVRTCRRNQPLRLPPGGMCDLGRVGSGAGSSRGYPTRCLHSTCLRDDGTGHIRTW